VQLYERIGRTDLTGLGQYLGVFSGHCYCVCGPKLTARRCAAEREKFYKKHFQICVVLIFLSGLASREALESRRQGTAGLFFAEGRRVHFEVA